MGLRDDLRELDRQMPGLKILLKWCAIGLGVVVVVVGAIGLLFGEKAAVQSFNYISGFGFVAFVVWGLWQKMNE
jgi:hypothetical protein